MMVNGEKPGDNDTGKQVMLALEQGAVQFAGAGGADQKEAVIRPGRGVEVFVNGHRVEQWAAVAPGDRVEIRTLEEVIEDRLEVKISADGLRAEARYTPGVRTTHTIADHPWTDDLKVEGLPLEESYQGLTPEELIVLAGKQGIVYGLDEAAPANLLENQSSWLTVASGKPVRPGRDGWVEPRFEGRMVAVAYDQQAGRVDFRKRFEIEQAGAGDTIALVHPPQPGEAGKKVTGEDIAPAVVKPVEVQCEEGARLSGDGGRVEAERAGRPSYYLRGQVHCFRVDNLYTHKGDIDIKSGSIHFPGHFKVQGSITEGMKVSADGNIEVAANASGAEILAGGSVLFKANCIRCKVQAGWLDILLRNIYGIIDRMAKDIASAIEASGKIAKTLEARGRHTEQMEAAVVRALLQSKYTELPPQAESLLKLAKEAGRSLPEQLLEGIRHIAPHFIDYQYSQTLSRPVLEEVYAALQTLAKSRVGGSERADIAAPYVQNSDLTCTGNILISGPGVYNSRLRCSGEVHIARLFRGGSVEAGGDVYIGEAGSPRVSSDQGLIQVPYKARVHLGAAYENLRVRFGATEYRCNEELRQVRLVLDQQEYEVVIQPWENKSQAP